MGHPVRRALVFGTVGLAAGAAAVAGSMIPRPTIDEPLQPVDWPGRAEGDVIEELRAGYDSEVEPILRDHCYACHVDDRFARGEPWLTEWIPPLDQRVKEHVKLGNAALDLSGGFPFLSGGQVELDRQVELLRRLARSVSERTMPPQDFVLLHPLDPITDDQRDVVNEWAQRALARLTGTQQLSGIQGQILTGLARTCGGCHGADRTIGGPEITDLAALVEAGWVVPRDPGASKMLNEIQGGRMPPGGGESGDLLADLERWVEDGASVGTNARTVQSREDLLQAVADDLRGLPQGRRRFVRYFSAEHLAPVRQGPAGVAVAGDALRLVLSGLSRTPNPAVVELIKKSPAVFRVDLSSIGIPPEDLAVLDVAYPLDWMPQGRAGDLSQEIRRETGGGVDVYALDWMVRTATIPPLYPTLRQLPDRMSELARGEGVELCRLDGDQVRAGFRKSGVSAFNRIVERQDTASGAFWISYDFGRREDDADVLKRPLGPPCTGVPDAFVPDGSELIWSLPNGLHAYALYDGDGHRLDIDAPRDIVQDGSRAISNASSCMGCHMGGFLDVTNEVSADGAASSVAGLYASDAVLKSHVSSDNVAYRAALLAAGISPVHERPPVTTIRGRFEQLVEPDEVAAFLGLAPSVLGPLANLPAASPLAPLGRGQSIPRVELLRAFPELIEVLAIGKARPPLERLPFDDQERRAVLQTPRTVDARAIRYRTEQIPVQDGLLLVGTTEVSQANWRQILGEPPLSCLRPILLATFDEALMLGRAERPAVCLKFGDALAFANALSEREGLTPAYVIRDADVVLRPGADGYRLPTDGEWLGFLGSRDGRFPGDVSASAACGIANVLTATDRARLGDASGLRPDDDPDRDAPFLCDDGFAGLAPVGSLAPNVHGLFDLAGNAAEWTWPDGETSVALDAPQSLRGGSWLSGMATAPASTIVRRPGNSDDPTAGFRLVRPQARPAGFLAAGDTP